MSYEQSALETQVLCLKPDHAIVNQNKDGFSKMFSSHSWVVEYSKPQGNGFYVAFSCRRCGAVGHAIIEKR